MKSIENLISEINKLDQKELELVLNEILQRIDRKKLVLDYLDKFIGKGEGVWDIDAQEKIDMMREGDRV